MTDQLIDKASRECEVNLKIALVKHNLTQREMAAMIGTGPQQVNRAIKGDTSPSSKRIREKMKNILGISDF